MGIKFVRVTNYKKGYNYALFCGLLILIFDSCEQLRCSDIWGGKYYGNYFFNRVHADFLFCNPDLYSEKYRIGSIHILDLTKILWQ